MMRSRRRLTPWIVIAPLAALCVVTAPPLAAVAPPPRVLVMPFTVETSATGPAAAATRWLGEAASTLLEDELAAQGFGALSRDNRVAVFDRLHVPMSSELTRATLIRVAELAGASEIVFGAVQLGDDLSVRVRTIRLDTGQLLPEVADRAALSDIFELFRRVATSVGQRTGRAPAPLRRAVPAMPLPALENYVKGLMAATPATQQRFLESAMGQAPRDGRVLTALWELYADQGLHEKALAVASAVPADSMQYRRSRFDVALSLIELKRYDGAAKELAALHAQQSSSAVSNALGVVELRRTTMPGAATKAAPFFQRAATEAPGETDYLFNIGYAHALSGDSARALTSLREAVRFDAADGDAHLVMAAVLATTGRTAESQRELDLARLLGTSLETVPASAGKVPPSLERLPTDLDDALLTTPAFASAANRDQKETAEFHLSRARALVEENRDREAIANLQRSVYLAPYQDEPHLLLGRLYERAGRVSDAIDELKVAIWCRETAAARIALGRVYVSSGDKDAARKEFERALVLAPDSAEARDWLRKIGG
jgi:tetratricopeptide (TPR) repeat protein